MATRNGFCPKHLYPNVAKVEGDADPRGVKGEVPLMSYPGPVYVLLIFSRCPAGVFFQ